MYCLVRASSNDAAKARVRSSLEKRGISPSKCWKKDHAIICLASALDKPHLGLPRENYEELSRNLGTGGVIIHAAWPVNFAAQVESFETQFIGVRALLDLVGYSTCENEYNHLKPPRMIFISSTASVINAPGIDMILEAPPSDVYQPQALGYSQSKWVAERICLDYCKRELNGLANVQIIRVGQLCGDTKRGIWSESEGWPLLFAAGLAIGAMPYTSAGDTNVNWLPVDLAARMINEIAEREAEKKIFHVWNPKPESWYCILAWLDDQGYMVQFIEPEEWVAKVKAWVKEKRRDPVWREKSDKPWTMDMRKVEGIRGMLPIWETQV